MALNAHQRQERAEYLEHNLVITECSQYQPYVFISYASDNWETVFKSAVVPLQKQYGMRVYADKAFDKVNDKWIVPMLRNIRGAEVVIAFVSQSYIESYACFLELLTAVNSRKQIVFVSLEQGLRLGDTTDQPVIERGAKNEILNQGANMITNINNTSNDIMRAMKSAYTSLSTLVEQDALSKYDLSDAFINFFRDASVNRKSINDLNSIRYTVASISNRVFDPSLVLPAGTPFAPQYQSADNANAAAAAQGAQGADAQTQTAQGTDADNADAAATAQDAQSAEMQGTPAPDGSAPVVFTFDNPVTVQEVEPQASGGKSKKKIAIFAAIGAAVLMIIIFFAVIGSSSGDDDMARSEDTQSDEDGGSTDEDGAQADDGDVYEGSQRDGKPEGSGTMTYANGDVYEGAWQDGQREGQGKCTYADGSVYDGSWKADQPDGRGTWKYANGDVYDGAFAAGQREGEKGVMTYASGDVYEGEWKADQREGQGKYTYADGTVYDGAWVADQKEGQGTMTYASGDVYEGEWKADQREGQGKYTFADGTVCDGAWVANQREGQGTTTFADGDYFKGEYQSNKKNGYGTYVFANGSVYTGIHKDDTMNGEGSRIVCGENGELSQIKIGDYVEDKLSGLGATFSFDDADKALCVGYFEEGALNGQGIKISFADGSYACGTFVDGECTESADIQTVQLDVGEYYGQVSSDGTPEGFGYVNKSDGGLLVGLFSGGKFAYGYNRNGGGGSYYLGESQDGGYTGYAFYYFENGGYLVSHWQGSKRNGPGFEVNSDGKVSIGVWEEDQLVEEW